MHVCKTLNMQCSQMWDTQNLLIVKSGKEYMTATEARQQFKEAGFACRHGHLLLGRQTSCR